MGPRRYSLKLKCRRRLSEDAERSGHILIQAVNKIRREGLQDGSVARAYCVEKFEPGVRLEESNQRRSSKTDCEGRPASARGEPALTFSQSAGPLSLHTNLRGYLSICLLGNISRGDVTCWTSQGGEIQFHFHSPHPPRPPASTSSCCPTFQVGPEVVGRGGVSRTAHVVDTTACCRPCCPINVPGFAFSLRKHRPWALGASMAPLSLQ